MYSYEDRIRAVELYIKLGKRVRASIRQLGYPTKNSLKGWHGEYERCLNLPRGYVRSKPKYSQAQRERAVEHYLEQGRCIAFTIKTLGYPARDSLRSWIHERHPELHMRHRSIQRDSAATSDEAGGCHRVVHAAGECISRGSRAGRVPADLVQLEKPATQPRGSGIHEAPTRFTARPGTGGAGAPARSPRTRHQTIAARTRPPEKGE